ncbi:MAG: hypothetical protein Q9184_006752 [Pyrenodesmia sp. 2 TL-2023]
MGNSSTKEQRAEARRPRQLDRRGLSSSSASAPSSPANPPFAEASSQQMYSSRAGRRSRPDISALLGITSHSSETQQTLETRRETKQEREARRLERERALRLKERERSMREEHVDGGYLVTQGVYTGIEDFDKAVVRQLMIERRLAPFWRGLNDWSESWTENQLIAAARGLPIPAPDEIPNEQDNGPFAQIDHQPRQTPLGNDTSLTIPITSRSSSYASDSSNTIPAPSQPLPLSDLSTQPTPSSGILRGRAKTLASLTTSSKPSGEAILPAEIQLPQDPHINGQRIEVFLYKETFECPICLIYYPIFGNKTRCCDQWICSECFVQIKRADPHPPEHVDSQNSPPSLATSSLLTIDSGEPATEGELISEPATCPFCKQTEFGITYNAPPFRRGLAYVNQSSSQQIGRGASAMSSSTSLSSGLSGGQLSPTSNISRRRAASVSATDISVITTDRVRPEWYDKLTNARAHRHRRSAAASALHAAAFALGGGNGEGRGFSPFGRRGLHRRGSETDYQPGGSAHDNMLAFLAERHAAGRLNRVDGHEWTPTGPGPLISARGSSRRNQMEDIENMMMMEAIRLSLDQEEERREKEEKQRKKIAKKQEKEKKKQQKSDAKADAKILKQIRKNPERYRDNHYQSTTGYSSRSDTSLPAEERDPSPPGKGKAARRPEPRSEQELETERLATEGRGDTKVPDREEYPWTPRMPGRSETDAGPSHPFVRDAPRNPQDHLERARAQLNPDLQASNMPFGSTVYRPSHLRTISNVSSFSSSDESLPGPSRNPFQGSSSSLEASPNTSGINTGQPGSSSEAFASGNPPGGGAGLEPMLNFRSLAEVIGKDDASKATHQASRTEPEESAHNPFQAPEDRIETTAETERSDSLATLQPNEEFHDSVEYPSSRSNRNSVGQAASGPPTEGKATIAQDSSQSSSFQ